jgi:hypothetical protein
MVNVERVSSKNAALYSAFIETYAVVRVKRRNCRVVQKV